MEYNTDSRPLLLAVGTVNAFAPVTDALRGVSSPRTRQTLKQNYARLFAALRVLSGSAVATYVGVWWMRRKRLLEDGDGSMESSLRQKDYKRFILAAVMLLVMVVSGER